MAGLHEWRGYPREGASALRRVFLERFEDAL
jgi:hypothetical protein